MSGEFDFVAVVVDADGLRRRSTECSDEEGDIGASFVREEEEEEGLEEEDLDFLTGGLDLFSGNTMSS